MYMHVGKYLNACLSVRMNVLFALFFSDLLPLSVKYLVASSLLLFCIAASSVVLRCAAKMKVLWVDASVNSYTVVVRPGNWISLPPGDDEDEDDEDI